MFINVLGREIELKFGALFIKKMDKVIGMKIEGVEIGKGINFLISGLKDVEETVLADVLINATDKTKNGINNIEEAFAAIDEIIVRGEEEDKEDALQEFANEILDELGKLPTIRRRLKRLED